MSELAYCEDLGDRLIVVNANPARRNILSPEYYAVLTDAMQLASNEPRICAVILRGEGSFFCAGGDLRELRHAHELAREARIQRIENLHDVVRSITSCTKPVIACIEGGAAGAGVSIAFACDLLVAGKSSQFTVAYVKAGLVPDGGLTHHLAQQIPRATLMKMALLGEAMPAEHLFSIGALSALVPDGDALAESHALVDKLAAGPSATQGVIKALVNSAANGDLAAQFSRESNAMVDALASDEAAEGTASFLEKRPPDFARLRTT